MRCWKLITFLQNCLLWTALILSGACSSVKHVDLTRLPGHLNPFGTGHTLKVETTQGFPSVERFFHKNVFRAVPLKMVGAAESSQAFRLWDDDYFLSLVVPPDHKVLVETMKKEDRKQPTLMLAFKDFVNVYNKTDQYMVNSVPDFLKKDVILPGPLQCDQIYENSLVENIMWFSSGGTKSVVHTDSVDNINCLYRGRKEFILIDPVKYSDHVGIDYPEGAYSGMDVDRVDFTKYPGMAKVEYYSVNLTAGDCLYIPYKWIHQVRSDGRNLAVNIWWDNYKNRQLDIDACPKQFNADLTLDKVQFGGFENAHGETMELREQLMEDTETGPVTLKYFSDMLTNHLELEAMNAGSGYTLTIRKIFDTIDKTGDGKITRTEVLSASNMVWDKVENLIEDLDALIAAIEEDYHQAGIPEHTRDEL